MIPSSTSDAMLNALTVTAASLHTAFPGTIGSSEVTGGTPAYARMTITFAASSGASRTLSGGVAFDVPACTVRWIGFWNATAFVGCAPNGGGTPKNFMAVPAAGMVVSAAHGYADGTAVVFFDGAPPAPLVEGTVYFTRDGTTDNFKIAATAGGAPISLTAPASFGCVVAAISEQSYASQSTHTLATATIAIPT